MPIPSPSRLPAPSIGRDLPTASWPRAAALLLLLALPPVLPAQTSPAKADDDQPVKLEEFTVQGYRASLAVSLDAKRAAGANIDVITAEDVGKFPDTNLAEALSHIPGVTIDRLFGEGERVSILGTDPNLNRTLLNGQPIATADWYILDTPSRQFNYVLLAPEVIGKAEVYRTWEPRRWKAPSAAPSSSIRSTR
jgi:iron complex outermembrane receptor protein